jgi:hypothetical protein
MNLDTLNKAIADAEKLLHSGKIPSFVLDEVITIYAIAIIKRASIISKQPREEKP